MSQIESEVFTPFRLDNIELRNRIVRTAAFEGMSPGGAPSDALIKHHRELARGGVALTTVAYCSVSPLGRTYDHQLLMRREIVPRLEELTDAVHREGAAASIQLGHSGYFAEKKVIGAKPLGASRVFNLYGLSFPRPMGEDELDEACASFVRASVLAREAGFDAVEIHAGHGYLLSQFLSPFTNRRDDRYGGSFENRARFPLRVVRRVVEAVGRDLAVIVKTNLSDGFEGGFGIDEAVELATRLEEAGASALVPSGGFVTRTPLYMLRGEVPVKEMAAVQEKALRRLGLTLFGHLLVQRYPFENLFFLEEAKRIREATKLPLVLVGGICSLEQMETGLSAGFELLALGRALVKDPDFPDLLARGELTESACDHCNKCIAEMDAGGVRCVLD